MPKKIGATIVPRNPVAQSPLLKKGGAHQVSKTTVRRNTRQAVKSQLEDWRDDLEFERSLKDESSFDELPYRLRFDFLKTNQIGLQTYL